MSSIHREILQQYWGYTSFRPLQEDIVESVSSGRDTLGLMRTGGGKSITFQVPALEKNGICLVVTPLIALMKDQVENIQKKGIKALAIHSGLTREEIRIVLDNCIYGGFKFLYLSPERLATELFLTKLPHLNVNLLAIDEAHCISQWGYDFRPAYLKIAEIRKHIPDVPVLALTATATPVVVDDIQTQLGFKEKNLFQKSFERSNLAYVVRRTENKQQQLLSILKSVHGTAIVYVRSRKKTREYAELLKQNGISADYFHAGLEPKQKNERQARWKNNVTQVIVSTNAFGMGIDKPDVRVVVHIDSPDSLEAYFQEAGRAGRDGNKAYAVLLWSPTDKASLNRSVTTSFPEIAIVKRVYDALGNFFQIAVGAGINEVFDFNMGRFCAAFGFNVLTVLNSLKILQSAGYLSFSEEVNIPSRIKMLFSDFELYKFQVANAALDPHIKVLLRSYTGLFTEYAAIDEEMLSKRVGATRDEFYNALLTLSRNGVVHYIPQRQTPLITYLERRMEVKHLAFPSEIYKERKEQYRKRVDAVIDYGETSHNCRSRILLNYFGQNDSTNCGHCDVCIERRKTELTDVEFDEIAAKIKNKIAAQPVSIEQLVDSFQSGKENVRKVIAWMEDVGTVSENEQGILECIKK
jgi:ATP-dependent DNA helicase RecQ